MRDVRAEIEEMVHRETRAWDAQNAEALVELFHPDMVWPWPPGPRDHNPETWIFFLGRFHRERWKTCWEELFHTHTLIHNKRVIRKIEISKERDAALAVVDIDTLWHDQQGRNNHWKGRVSKGYTKMANGEWKLIFHRAYCSTEWSARTTARGSGRAITRGWCCCVKRKGFRLGFRQADHPSRIVGCAAPMRKGKLV